MKLFFDFILIDNKLLISCYHELTSLVASHRSLATQIMIQYNLEKLNFKAQNLSSVTVNGSDEKDIENKFTEILNNIKDKFTYDTFFLGADLNLGLDSKKPAGFLFQEQKIRKIFADKKGLKIYCIFSSSNPVKGVAHYFHWSHQYPWRGQNQNLVKYYLTGQYLI